jgi:membrane protease YdiL (CAAX protease family)
MEEIEKQSTDSNRLSDIPWTVLDVIKAILLTIGIFILLASAIIVFAILFTRSVPDLEEQFWLLLILTYIPLFSAMILCVWLFTVRKYRIPWSTLGFRRFSIVKGLLMGAGVVATGIVANIIYAYLLQALGAEPPSTLPYDFTEVWHNWTVLAFFVVFAAPIAEELFFRGFVFPGISKRWGYRWGIVISGAFFAALHVGSGGMVPIFILGMLLAWLYIKTGSLWPCIFAHFAYNSLALLFMVIY